MAPKPADKKVSEKAKAKAKAEVKSEKPEPKFKAKRGKGSVNIAPLLDAENDAAALASSTGRIARIDI